MPATVDGRNRYAACQALGLDPETVVYEGLDLAEYVIDCNTTRRHMSTGQRAMASALVLADDGRREGGRWKRESVDISTGGNSGWPKRLAECGVILDYAPELAAEVVAGETPLKTAFTTADDRRRSEEAEELGLRLLGWDEVPVTVVDLATAADVLRAEMDENVCRKSLTLIEASRARQRRAEALAPIAAERKAQAPGLPQGAKVSSSKLDEETPSTARETRKVAAIGTGYSGSTLDKVDRVREIAERGTLTTRGATKPVPEPVVEIAKAAVVLKAEMDENVCRKSLTLIEASRARERRAKALAPAAAERERAGVKQPSSNLDEGPSTARATRKVAAIGTGYSGSTLDKVDRVREIAERGTLTTKRFSVFCVLSHG